MMLFWGERAHLDESDSSRTRNSSLSVGRVDSRSRPVNGTGHAKW
jgi:hypothetical protein